MIGTGLRGDDKISIGEMFMRTSLGMIAFRIKCGVLRQNKSGPLGGGPNDPLLVCASGGLTAFIAVNGHAKC